MTFTTSRMSVPSKFRVTSPGAVSTVGPVTRRTKVPVPRVTESTGLGTSSPPANAMLSGSVRPWVLTPRCSLPRSTR